MLCGAAFGKRAHADLSPRSVPARDRDLLQPQGQRTRSPDFLQPSWRGQCHRTGAGGIRRTEGACGDRWLSPGALPRPLCAADSGTVAARKDIDLDYVIPLHCTGEPFYDKARTEMPGKVLRSYTGTRFVFS